VTTPASGPARTGPGARRALDGAAAVLDGGPGPAQARTVVRLLRYAVETALDDYWESARPGEVPPTVGRGKRLRLLAATPLGRAFAHETYTTWCRLSDAARPHAHETAPSVMELRALQAGAEAAVAGLCGGPTSSPA
jgi:hypothetical protein